ncbi:heme ABC exporter ATP-binding protein CcmA [Parvibaculum sp.]|uniref:heme ABC exporter ATP-binding protein CcmA n=1 Tax=Parvibaculum sp. TaxID=2024848 RepID=UPI001B091A10|nr:heme ABC exporter ATP-binding protein CcmA [Parvibaculum sp.]MBO6636091.1 heme ABC exporter ATP-binding protein CcmA [Parvibaculum sp.]MBO6677294.1 heme ABC exporter ATP-binding protein CcmA [Parvibaculum sp.]MBO6684950.1 heme ABC exporter ATP-binding protein CcmA [Parvibaculum sp.]MBO6904713.1 heme ABC exporter ATP-binding protein CcmA [Parvibaculum sp.]
MTTSDLRLSARDLACERGGRLVFESLEFDVAAGEALVLTGPNGSGKSSLLRQIAGLLEIGRGQIELTGGDPERALGEQAHYLGHLDALKPSMSVLETIRFWALYLGGSAAAAQAALDDMALGDLADLPVAYLSAGQRRRLALARLAAVPRPLWLLDEPTVALDQASVGRLRAFMAAHLAGGGIIVAATHLDLGLGTAKSLRLGAEEMA